MQVDVALVLFCSAPLFAQAHKVKPPELLIPFVKPPASPEVVRTRLATFNTAVLHDKRTFAGDHPRLTFNLFEEKGRFIGIVDRTDEPVPGSRSWSGSLEGQDGTFTLIYYNGRPFLNVHVGDRFYEVRPTGDDDTVLVQEIDTTKLPPDCGGANDHSMRKTFPSQSRNVCDTDPNGANVTIDALVVYTAAARSAAGGTTQIEGGIVNNLDETNQTFERSHINARLQVATLSSTVAGVGRLPIGGKCVVEVAYAESGLVKTDLDRLTDPNDGSLDEVPRLRDACNADVVLMIVNKADWGGKAWIMGSLGNEFAPFAFGVVYLRSSSGNYAFTHELGHYNGKGPPTGAPDANNVRTLRISAETVSKFR